MNPEMKRHGSLVILVIEFSLWLLFIGCTEKPPDRPMNETLAAVARAYIVFSQGWFIPPESVVFGGGSGAQKNSTGAYPCADNGLLNSGSSQETMSTCDDKLLYATQKDQSNWSEYLNASSDSRAGWPGGVAPNPSREHKAGFICYVLVAQALKDAGYSIDPNSVLSSDWFASNYSIVSGSAEVGDIVLYDFDRNGSYDHVGIITDISGSDQNQYSVVSSIGIVEHFSYGAAQKRLGVFGSATTGGDFSVWNPAWEPIYKRIVRPE